MGERCPKRAFNSVTCPGRSIQQGSRRLQAEPASRDGSVRPAVACYVRRDNANPVRPSAVRHVARCAASPTRPQTMEKCG